MSDITFINSYDTVVVNSENAVAEVLPVANDVVVASDIGIQGPKGDKGDKGDAGGEPGAQGPPGEQGSPGRDGQIRFTGQGPPPVVIVGSIPGDVYMDLSSGNLYKLI